MFRVPFTTLDSDGEGEESENEEMLPWQVLLRTEHAAAQCYELKSPLAIGSVAEDAASDCQTDTSVGNFIYTAGVETFEDSYGQCSYELLGGEDDLGQRYWIWLLAQLPAGECGREKLEVDAGGEKKYWILCHHHARPNSWAWQQSPFSLSFSQKQVISFKFLTCNTRIAQLWFTTDAEKKPPSFQPDDRPVDVQPLRKQALLDPSKPWTAFRTPDTRSWRTALKLHRRYILSGLKSAEPEVTKRSLFVPNEWSDKLEFNLPTAAEPSPTLDIAPGTPIELEVSEAEDSCLFGSRLLLNPQAVRVAFEDGRRAVSHPFVDPHRALDRLTHLGKAVRGKQDLATETQD